MPSGAVHSNILRVRKGGGYGFPPEPAPDLIGGGNDTKQTRTIQSEAVSDAQPIETFFILELLQPVEHALHLVARDVAREQQELLPQLFPVERTPRRSLELGD